MIMKLRMSIYDITPLPRRRDPPDQNKDKQEMREGGEVGGYGGG